MYRRFGWLAGFLLLGPLTAKGDAPKPSDKADKIIEEIWEAAQLEGVKIGSVHTTVRDVGGDEKRLRATVALELTFKRHNATMQLRMERGDEETADGEVVGVFMRQYQDQAQKVALSGVLEDGRMHVQIDGGRIDRRLRWSDEIVGRPSSRTSLPGSQAGAGQSLRLPELPADAQRRRAGPGRGQGRGDRAIGRRPQIADARRTAAR